MTPSTWGWGHCTQKPGVVVDPAPGGGGGPGVVFHLHLQHSEFKASLGYTGDLV